MEMVKIDKSISNIENQITTESSWEDLAYVINFATNLQRIALDVSIKKGIEEGKIRSEIIGTLINSGCKLKRDRIGEIFNYYDFKVELSNPSCRDSETKLKQPENEGQFRRLGSASASTSAVEKAEEFTEMYDEKGSAPSNREIAEANAKKTMLKEKLGKKEELEGLPHYLGVDEIADFRQWLIDKKSIDYLKSKPKVPMRTLIAERDEVLDELYTHIGEWKAARKLMQDRLHPDKGGNTLAFQFFNIFDELMRGMVKMVDLLDYENSILEYKKEWWSNK